MIDHVDVDILIRFVKEPKEGERKDAHMVTVDDDENSHNYNDNKLIPKSSSRRDSLKSFHFGEVILFLLDFVQ